jgi:hypothetical protein
VWDLSADREQTLSRFPGRLKQAPALSPGEHERVVRWLADLDSARFAVRERASAELARLGDMARPDLKKALADHPALEVRRRVERLLEKIEQRVPAGDELRAPRAVEVLENIATPAASKLLEALAGGAAGAGLTREAMEALARLARQAAAKP